jgi:hypothetical protein
MLNQEAAMLLTCPQCKAIFCVDRLHPERQPVHYMICDGLMKLINKGRAILTAYFLGLTTGLHQIDLTILLPIDTLLVVNLEGSYAEMLRDCGFWSRGRMEWF